MLFPLEKSRVKLGIVLIETVLSGDSRILKIFFVFISMYRGVGRHDALEQI